MTRSDLEIVFSNGSRATDEKNTYLGKALRETDLKANGFTKKELRRLVESGAIIFMKVRDPAAKCAVHARPIINVYYLPKGESDA